MCYNVIVDNEIRLYHTPLCWKREMLKASTTTKKATCPICSTLYVVKTEVKKVMCRKCAEWIESFQPIFVRRQTKPKQQTSVTSSQVSPTNYKKPQTPPTIKPRLVNKAFNQIPEEKKQVPPTLKINAVVPSTPNDVDASVPVVIAPSVPNDIDVVTPVVARKLGDHLKSQPHTIVDALAGTGKTFTEIEMAFRLLGINRGIVGSDQQEAIWDSIRERYPATEVKMIAFGKRAANELKAKVPPNVTAGTVHASGKQLLGFNSIGNRKYDFQSDKNLIILARSMGTDLGGLFRNARKRTPIFYAIARLVSFMKLNLINLTGDEDEDIKTIDSLADTHGYIMPQFKDDVDKCFLYSSVLDVYSKCFTTTDIIDYDDMIYLPWALNLSVKPVQFLFVDERQDLNKAQQELACRLGQRLFIAGDMNQAIYGFAGADVDACNRMEQRLSASPRGVRSFPLTFTRRCSHAVVEYARQFVPTFSCFPEAEAGSVSYAKETDFVDDVKLGDMVICRTNAPLFKICLNLMAKDIPFKTTVAQFFSQTHSLIKSFECTTLPELLTEVTDWKERQLSLCSETNADREIIIRDTFSAIVAGIRSSSSLKELYAKLQWMTKSQDSESNVSKDWVFLTSIHGAKGLEARRVFWLQYDLVPHPKARLLEQERNLQWVASTRALSDLILVESQQREEET